MRIDPSLFKNDNVENSGVENNIPPIVLAAIVVFSLLFLAGGIYLFMSGPFTGIDIIEPAELHSVVIAVKSYTGPLWKIENERKKVLNILEKEGLSIGEAITVFKKSPMKMRPLKINCEVGYLLGIGFIQKENINTLTIKKIKPGRRLIVKIYGKGNFSGNKAYKAAAKLLGPKGLAPAEGERFEIKKNNKSRGNQVEHWIPVR